MSFNKESLISLIKNKKENVKNQLLTLNNYASSLYKDNKIIINNEINKLTNAFKEKQNKCKNEFVNAINILDNISPLKVMMRGYSVVKTSNKNVTSISDVNVDEVIQVRVSDGKFYANVTKKEEN